MELWHQLLPRRYAAPNAPPTRTAEYTCGVATQPTARTLALRALVKENHAAILELLERYGASNPRLFGSVARGDAAESSDIDLMVDMATDGKDALWELSGLSEDWRQLLGVRVDVVCEKLLRADVAETTRKELVAL